MTSTRNFDYNDTILSHGLEHISFITTCETIMSPDRLHTYPVIACYYIYGTFMLRINMQTICLTHCLVSRIFLDDIFKKHELLHLGCDPLPLSGCYAAMSFILHLIMQQYSHTSLSLCRKMHNICNISHRVMHCNNSWQVSAATELQCL